VAIFSKILFPTDFSDDSRTTLERALALGGIHEGEVVVQHVVGTYFEKHSHFATLFDIHELQKYMDMYAETEMERLVPEDQDKVRFRTVISKGKTAAEIVRLAEEEKVDLIVMGPSTGAVTGGVIRGSNRPVLSLPSGGQPGPAGTASRILVATDFSDHSKKVVRYAIELKQELGASLDLLYAIELNDAIRFGIRQGHLQHAPKKIREWAENELENLTPHEFVSDPSVRRLVEEGPAAETIARVAAAGHADIVVMGAHGHGAVERFVLGTTTSKVLSKIQHPILTLRI